MNKKLSQNDLRRFMSDQKKKILVNGKKVDSPLAKYPLHTVYRFFLGYVYILVVSCTLITSY